MCCQGDALLLEPVSNANVPGRGPAEQNPEALV